MSVDEIKAAGAAGLKKLFKYSAWFIAFCAAVMIYGYVNRWMEGRAAKKAQTEEFFRRNAMTPEARLAEDSAKAKAAELKAAQQKRESVYNQGKLACIAAWKSKLKDPYSAILEGFDGGVDKNDDDQFYAEISGRAKNSFGAFVPGAWVCGARLEGGKMKITNFSELKY